MPEAFDLGEGVLHLPLHRRRFDPGVGAEDDRRGVARLRREAVFEKVERFLGIGSRQVEFFGEVRAHRCGQRSDPEQGDDPGEDHCLAVAGAPCREASHRVRHASNGGRSARASPALAAAVSRGG